MGCQSLTARRLGTRPPCRFFSLSISVRLLGTRLSFPEVVNSRLESMSTFLEFLFNLFSRDRRAHRSREPTFDRPSGSRERRVKEEVTAAVPRVVKPRAIIEDRRAHRSREPTFDRPSGSRERRVEENVVFRYTAPGGGTAAVPRVVKPYQVLQVTQNAPRAIIKAAFKRAANNSRRQERVMASLSYNILMSKVERYQKISDGSYKITKKDDVFVLAAVGDTASLLAQISKDSSLATCTDEHNHSVLYLTARAGFYDTTEALLKIGVSVNEKQVDGSTALHAACFYGQRIVGNVVPQHYSLTSDCLIKSHSKKSHP